MSPKMAENVWDKVWTVPDGWYPNEFIVRFLSKYVKRRTGLDSYHVHRPDIRRVLDLGCGTGRHIVMLARQGFETLGIDISEKGVSFARQWVAKEGLKADLRVGTTTQLPWDDRSIDAIVCHGVLDHMTYEDAQKTVREVLRVLKPNGLFYVSLISTRESAFGRGKEVAPFTFTVPEGAETGAIQRFFEKDHLFDLLGKEFEIMDIVNDEWQAIYGRGFSSAAETVESPRLARFHVAAKKVVDQK
jgi:2-polyprenyl-3-methyl-5-hydroxy-6-metoxy-1,4-benzoquinol methylase